MDYELKFKCEKAMNAYLSFVNDEASIAAVLLALLSVARLLFILIVFFGINQVLTFRFFFILNKIQI